MEGLQSTGLPRLVFLDQGISLFAWSGKTAITFKLMMQF